MKIVILDALMDSNPEDHVIKQLGSEHDLVHFQLHQMNIRQCTGCWSCWWKTPGICSIHDDAQSIMQQVIHCDLVVFASPVVAGFTSALLKTIQDRFIVLLHPYIEPIQGECHHRKRYDRYPDMALLLEPNPDTDEEDIEIITDIYHRLALNFHSNLKHLWLTSELLRKEATI